MQIKLLDVVVDNGKTRVTDNREVEVVTVDHDGNIEEKKVRLCDLELMQTDDMEFYVVDENNIRVEFKNLSDIALLKLSMDYEDMLRAVTELYEVAEVCVKEVTEDDANIAIVDLYFYDEMDDEKMEPEVYNRVFEHGYNVSELLTRYSGLKVLESMVTGVGVHKYADIACKNEVTGCYDLIAIWELESPSYLVYGDLEADWDDWTEKNEEVSKMVLKELVCRVKIWEEQGYEFK